MRNQLLRALQAGVLSPDDLTESEVAELTGAPGTPQPRFDIPEVPMNSMRAESGPDAGKVTSLNFRDAAGRQAPGGMTWDALNASLAQQPPPEGLSWDDLRARTGGGQKRQMRVVGAGNGSTVDLSPEDAGPVALDYTRPPVDVPGVGKAYYSKDGRGAYVMGPDGQPATKVILGYDDAGSRARDKANQETRAREATITQAGAATEHTREQTRASRVNNPEFMAGGTPGAPGPSGDALLSTLDPGIANTVKQMVEGRMAPPAGAALRNPRILQLVTLANQYDPGFDATTWGERYKTAQDFSSGGQSGRKVQAINQALHHASQLSDAIDKLNNSDVAPGIVNAPVNLFERTIMGDTRQGEFQTKANALAAELRKVYAGAGGGTLQELQKWEGSFDQNAGQTQQRAYLRAGMELLNGAIESHRDSYTRGMGPKADFGKLISPAAQADLAKVMGGGKGGDVKRVQTDADYDALPSGSSFVGPDGVRRRKP